MKTWTLLLVAANLCFSACNYIPCSASSDLDKVQRVPKPASLAGIYKPDEFTRQDYNEYSSSDTTFLAISMDGKIALNNFPKSTFRSWNESNIDIINGSGTWAASLDLGTTIIKTDIVFNQKGIMTPSPFRLFKKGEKYYILIDFGDPDNCTSVRLQQQ